MITVILIGGTTVVRATIKIRVLFLVYLLRRGHLIIIKLLGLLLSLLWLPRDLSAFDRLSVLLSHHQLLMLNLPDSLQVVI